MNRPRITWLAALLMLSAGCSGETASAEGVEVASASDDPLVGGTPTSSGPGVVQIRGYEGGTAQVCTGTTISPHVILSAAHCLFKRTQDAQGQAVFTRVSLFRVVPKWNAKDVPYTRQEGRAVTKATPHPRFVPARFWEGSDIAVLVLTDPLADYKDTPIGATAPTTVTAKYWPYSRAPITESNVGGDVVLFGYGFTASGVVRPDGSYDLGGEQGLRRNGAAKIMSVNSAPPLFMAGTPATPESPGVNQCPGDSGGPVFQGRGAARQIIGVSSYSASRPGELRCSKGVNTPTAAYLPFIDSKIVKFDPDYARTLGLSGAAGDVE